MNHEKVSMTMFLSVFLLFSAFIVSVLMRETVEESKVFAMSYLALFMKNIINKQNFCHFYNFSPTLLNN